MEYSIQLLPPSLLMETWLGENTRISEDGSLNFNSEVIHPKNDFPTNTASRISGWSNQIISIREEGSESSKARSKYLNL